MDVPKQSLNVCPKRAVLLSQFDPLTMQREDGKKQRATWNKQIEFILSCVGYAVGLGNIWRFPYLCYKSGGGAFLIPYFLFLLICGIPQFFLEMSLGQFASLGFVAVWKISPIFKGIGFGMAIISLIACVYYNVVIAWSLYYIYYSYSMPWSSCNNSWNTPNCVSQDDSIKNRMGFLNSTQPKDFLSSSLNVSKMMSSEEFWLFHVLRQSAGIDTVGALQWPLVFTLFTAWAIVFVCVAKGIKTSGKVVYVTATLPYFVLACLFIRGVTLPGSWNGIQFFLKPKWSKLLTFKVWGDAATQIFYSSGTTWGALLTMASHNKFDNNVYRDSLLIPLVNSGTSILSGFVVFSYLGFMSYETGKGIEDVVAQGPGLVFVVYPEAISRLPLSAIWAFSFFFMLFAVGLDTQFVKFESIVRALADEYPTFFQKRKTLFSAVLCLLLFVLGLPCVTQGGIYVVQLMDWYSAAFSLMFFSLFETIVVAWIYGVDRFALDISLMIKRKPSLWWKLCWCYITPASVTVLLLFIVINHTAITYGNYKYPTWSIVIGWILATCSIVPIPTVAFWTLVRKKGSLKRRIINSLRPTADWGPASEKNKNLYKKSTNVVSSRFGKAFLKEKPVSMQNFTEKSNNETQEKASEDLQHKI
ncbi:sodium- and chloride-dependent glycine transporter 2-like isoform X1 [Argiope bruennichi]|uniref:sodium- and chloride-dependent glycine transporter 2-like isoform X1 n=3 Tax=Argiope bruennichi TaxID=94029 RepID=UPI002494A040|nr:sodium- and chloride-dependent glycine transporter 2-like isoform X1 [Argiope bruennichi]